MQITEIRIFLANEEKLKAYVTVIFDGCFVIRDIKIIQNKTGLFVAMPSKKRRDGTFKDIAHPVNTETRVWMENAILEAFKNQSMSESAPHGLARTDDTNAAKALK